jgi:PAS domain S-box-containing protein
MTNSVDRSTIHSDGAVETPIARRDVSNQHSMLEPVGVGVGRFTTDGRWLLASSGLCRMLGYRRRELFKTTIEEMTHPADWPRQKKLLQRMMSGDTDSYTLEKRYVCRSSLPLWVTETCSAARKDDGSYLYTAALVEANERKRTEELFQMTLEASPNAIAIANTKGEIVLVNSKTEKIFDYQRGELLGRTMDSILPDVLNANIPFSFGNLHIELMQVKWDSHGRRKDGTIFPVEMGVRAIETGHGTWTIISIADLSELKQADEQLLEMRIAS